MHIRLEYLKLAGLALCGALGIRQLFDRSTTIFTVEPSQNGELVSFAANKDTVEQWQEQQLVIETDGDMFTSGNVTIGTEDGRMYVKFPLPEHGAGFIHKVWLYNIAGNGVYEFAYSQDKKQEIGDAYYPAS